MRRGSSRYKGRPARKQSVYVPDTGILEELLNESKRLDRTVAWLLQRAWVLARSTIKRFPSGPTR